MWKDKALFFTVHFTFHVTLKIDAVWKSCALNAGSNYTCLQSTMRDPNAYMNLLGIRVIENRSKMFQSKLAFINLTRCDHPFPLKYFE